MSLKINRDRKPRSRAHQERAGLGNRAGAPQRRYLSKKSRRMTCPRCKAPKDAVVEIQPLIHEAGLVAYECPACLYVTSILWHPGEPE